MSTLHDFDTLYQASRPTVMMPIYSPLPPLAEAGERLIVASNGIFLDVEREWITARVQIAPALPISVPYGEAQPMLDLKCGMPPKRLLDAFLAFARRMAPIECGGILTWKTSGEWRFYELESEAAGVDHLSFIRPELDEDEFLIVDVHSHGNIPALFSQTDNRQDTVGELKIAGVYGEVRNSTPSECWRICFNSFVVPHPVIHRQIGFDAIELSDVLNPELWGKLSDFRRTKR